MIPSSGPIYTQVEYGQLKVCFRLRDANQTSGYCLIEAFQEATVNSGTPLLNEQDCPLLFALDNLIVIPATDVINTVSIVHQCSTSCKLVAASRTCPVE